MRNEVKAIWWGIIAGAVFFALSPRRRELSEPELQARPGIRTWHSPLGELNLN